MKITYSRFCTLLVLALLTMTTFAADKYVKREVRGVWLATVYNIDWPATTGTTISVRNTQKKEMTGYLDILKKNNFNAVYFQVRSMCDVMYKSSYEPWSSYLTGTRGRNPNWDPLAFVVEECHKRGMECHAWVNPYRWSSSGESAWNTTQDKKLKSDGWLISFTNSSGTTTTILNPALPEVRQRIVDVCQELVHNYDIDGIIFDDYFYPSGMPTTSEAEDYQDYKDASTSMSYGDWRRANVNQMVADVYNMIQEEDPSCKFGISPAGAACTDATVAASHGITKMPVASDWQYNGIFSDPVAWLEAGTIDYISPQIYWKTNHSTNPFGPMTKWWSQVAKHFGRHHYASHSLSFLQSSNTEDDWKEVGQQMQYSRAYTMNSAPGQIYYSACDIDGHKVSGLGKWLLENKYQHPALTPAITWKKTDGFGKVTGLQLEDNVLTWDALDHVRYTVYAIPEDVDSTAANVSKSGGILADYLLQTVYTNTYTIPTDYQTGYYYAVCILDRYGNEYAPRYSSEIETGLLDMAEREIDISLDGWTLQLSRVVDDVQVVSTTGQILAHEQSCNSLSLSGFPTGIYIVKAQVGRQNIIKKIILR